MGSGMTGTFPSAEEVLILSCDVCECDVGYADSRRPRPH